MHTYRCNSADSVWEVGHYEPCVEWNTETFGVSSAVWRCNLYFSTEVEAAAYTSYLNGGARPQ